MGFFYFLAVLAILAVACVVILLVSRNSEEEPEIVVPPPRQLGPNLGAPLFTDGDTKQIALVLCAGDYVWALTPFGPQRMQVTAAKAGEAHLTNGEFEALAFLDSSYFSESVAKKLGRTTGAWRIERILPRLQPSVPKNDPSYEAANRRWLQEEYYDGEDELFDVMVFYVFLFEGFHQPYTYYEMYEPPVYDDPEPMPEPLPEEPIEAEPVEEEPVAEEPVPPGEDPAVDDTQDMPAVPSEVTEETFEEVAPEPEPEPAPEPPTVEPEPAPEPEPTPAPEPEPDKSWSGGGYDSAGGYGQVGGSDSDSGSSYDSGGSDSGGDW